MYQYNINQTANNKADAASLKAEIGESSITIAVASILIDLTTITVNFKANVSPAEVTELDSIIANHDGEPLEDTQTLQTVQVLPQGGKRKTDRGFSFTATAGQITSHTHTFTEDLYIKEGIMFTSGQDFFDQITAEFIDTAYSQAGVLYPSEPFLAGASVPEGTPWSAVYPGGVPLHAYIKDFPVDPSGKTHSVNEALTELNMKGISIKMSYDSKGQSDVKVNVGIVAYS